MTEAAIWLKEYGNQLSEEQQGPLRLALVAVTNSDDERVGKVLELPRRGDIHAGLFYPATPTKYQKDQELYRVPGWLEGYLKLAHDNEAPLPFHFWSGVTVLGAAARRNFYLPHGVATAWPNHYVVLVSTSGSGKSTAIGGVAHRLMLETNDRLRVSGFEMDKTLVLLPQQLSLSYMLNALRVHDPMPMPAQEAKQSAVKQLPITLRSESTGIIFAPELSTLLGKDTAQAALKFPFLLECWDCPPVYDDGKLATGYKKLRNVAISLLGGTTPELMKKNMHPNIMTGGFAGRAIWVCRTGGTQPHARPRPFDPLLADELVRYLDWLGRSHAVHPIQFDAEADEWWDAHYKGKLFPKKSASDSYTSGYWSRKGQHIKKLALLMRVSLGAAGPVTLEMLQRANDIIDWEERPTLAFFRAIRLPEAAARQDEILDLLMQAEGWVSFSQIASKMRPSKRQELKDDLEMLDLMRRAQRVSTVSAGNNRPTHYYRADGPWRDEDPTGPEWDPKRVRGRL